MSTKIKCKTSQFGESLSIALELQKATQKLSAIYDLNVQTDCLVAYSMLKNPKKKLWQEENATATRLHEDAQNLMVDKK